MTTKFELAQFKEHVGAKVSLFVRRESFETRADVVLRTLLAAGIPCEECWNFCAAGRASNTNGGFFRIFELRHLSAFDPNDTTKEIRACARRIAVQPAGASVLVDVTAFRREELLILLRMLARYHRQDVSVTLLYVPAASYADNWLSRGVVECRSVVGFSGDFSPSRPDHLVLMLGFELDRARALIDFYEPARVSIGHGSFEHSLSPEFFSRNMKVFGAFLEYALPSDRADFEFAPEDPLATAVILERVLDAAPEYNHIVAPLNNKISAIGAGVLGLMRPDVQIGYAVAAEYNESSYSTPADSICAIDFGELMAVVNGR